MFAVDDGDGRVRRNGLIPRGVEVRSLMKTCAILAVLIAVGVGIGSQFRRREAVGPRQKMAEDFIKKQGKKDCKPCSASPEKAGEAVAASLVPAGVLGSLLSGPTACSWGIKDFSEVHDVMTTSNPNGGAPLHHHVQIITGPCQSNGSTQCTGVVVRMLMKWNQAASPPGWEVKALTCESIATNCGDYTNVDKCTYDSIDENVVSLFGNGDYCIAVDIYRGTCSPLGSHVYGATFGPYTL